MNRLSNKKNILLALCTILTRMTLLADETPVISQTIVENTNTSVKDANTSQCASIPEATPLEGQTEAILVYQQEEIKVVENQKSSSPSTVSLLYSTQDAESFIECCPQDCFDSCSPGFFVFGEGGYQVFRNLPTLTFGAVVFGAGAPSPSPYFFTAEGDRPESAYGRFGLGISLPYSLTPCWCGTETSFSVSGFFASDTLNSSTSFTAFNNEGVIITHIDGSDATLFGLGTSIVSTSLKREYKYKGIEFMLGSFYPFPINQVCLLFQPYVSLAIDNFEQDYGINLSELMNLSENLSTIYYDLGGGFELEFPLLLNFSGFINAGGFLSFARTSFIAHQVITSEIAEFFEIDWYNNNTSGKFKGSLGLETHFRKIDLGVIGRYEYWGYLPKVNNPTIQPVPATIGEAFLSTYSIGLYAIMNF